MTRVRVRVRVTRVTRVGVRVGVAWNMRVGILSTSRPVARGGVTATATMSGESCSGLG